MALSESVPWIGSPAMFGEAMRAGASAGLSLRKQEQEEAETADRLRLAYDQLSSKERQAGVAVRQKLDLTRQGMSLRQAQNEKFLSLHRDQLEEQKRRNDLQFGKLSSPASEIQRVTNPNTGLQEGIIYGKTFHPMKETELTGEDARKNENLKSEISKLASAWMKAPDTETQGNLRLAHDQLKDEQQRLWASAAAKRLRRAGLSVSAKKPTRAEARQYVERHGQSGAIDALKAAGYDTSGYAD